MATKKPQTAATTTTAREEIPGVGKLAAKKAKPLTGAALASHEKKVARLAREAEAEAQPEVELKPEAVAEEPNIEKALESIEERYHAELRSRAQAWRTGNNPPQTQEKLEALVQRWLEKAKLAEAKKAAEEAARQAKLDAAAGGDIEALQEVITQGLARPQDKAITTSRDVAKWRDRVRKTGSAIKAKLLAEVCTRLDKEGGLLTSAEVRRKGILTPSLNAAMSRLEAGAELDEEKLMAALIEAAKEDAEAIAAAIAATIELRSELKTKVESLRKEALQDLLKAAPGTCPNLRNGLLMALTGRLRHGLSPTALAELARNEKLLGRLTEILEGSLEGLKAVEAEPKPEPVAEPTPQPEPQPELQPEAVAEPEVEQPEPVTEPEPELTPEPVTEPEPVAEPTPELTPEEVAKKAEKEAWEAAKKAKKEAKEAKKKVKEDAKEAAEGEVKETLKDRVKKAAKAAKETAKKVKAAGDRFGQTPTRLSEKDNDVLRAVLAAQPEEGSALLTFTQGGKDPVSKALNETFGALARAHGNGEPCPHTWKAYAWFFQVAVAAWARRTGTKVAEGAFKNALYAIKGLPGSNQDWLANEAAKIWTVLEDFKPSSAQAAVLEAIAHAPKVAKVKGEQGSTLAHYSWAGVLLVARGLVGFAKWGVLPFRAIYQIAGSPIAAIKAAKGKRGGAAKAKVASAWEQVKAFGYVTPKDVLSRLRKKVAAVFARKPVAEVAVEALQGEEKPSFFARSKDAVVKAAVAVKEEAKAHPVKTVLKGVAVAAVTATVAVVTASVTLAVVAAVVGIGVAMFGAKPVVGAVKAVGRGLASFGGWIKGLFGKKGTVEAAPAASA